MLKLIKEYKLFQKKSFWSVMLFLLCMLPFLADSILEITNFSTLTFIVGVIVFHYINKYFLKSSFGFTEIFLGYLKITNRLLDYFLVFGLVLAGLVIIFIILLKYNLI